MMEFVPQDNVNVKNLKTFFFFFFKNESTVIYGMNPSKAS